MEPNDEKLLWSTMLDNPGSTLLLQKEEIEYIAETMFEMNSNSSSEFLLSSNSSSDSELTSDSEHEDQPSFVQVIDAYDNDTFRSQMRMQRTTVDSLLKKFSRSNSLPPQIGGKKRIGHKTTLYIFIWYIGSFVSFRQLANLFGVSISTAWTAVHRITSWIMSIGHKYVIWPQGNNAEETQEKFKEKHKIPGVLGAIGCTNITIKSPKVKKANYFDVNKNYSIVLQAIVDADEKFIHINCGEPGALNYNTVLRISDLFKKVESNPNDLFPQSSFLLGDSSYSCADWLVTPFKDTGSLTDTQKKFNEIHASTRFVVTNTLALLKARFRRFLKITEQINITTVSNIIVSSCILHNICITEGDYISDYEPVQMDVSSLEQPNEDNIEDINVNRRERLFRELLKKKLLDSVKQEDVMQIIDSYDNEEFEARMGLQRTNVEDLLEQFAQHTLVGEREKCIDYKKMFYLYMWYTSQPGSFANLAQLFDVSVSTAWRAIHRVTSWLSSIGRHDLVKEKCLERSSLKRKHQE